MKKAYEIIAIVKPITHGMYEDEYTVYYGNGMKRKYNSTGKVIAKHLHFMMNAKCEKIENHEGKHVGDRYIKAGEEYENKTLCHGGSFLEYQEYNNAWH